MKPLRTLIIDHSALVRMAIANALSVGDRFKIEFAADLLNARAKMDQEWPDVIVLDANIPRMDSLAFLKIIMAERPTPVVICSNLDTPGAPTALQALAIGAVDVIERPQAGLREYQEQYAIHVVHVVAHAARAGLTQRSMGGTRPVSPKMPAPVMVASSQLAGLVAIGASTGGTRVLESVLSALPRECPPIMVVQHMPEHFTAAFAERLNSVCALEVREAKNGDRVLPGQALIAPGGRQMALCSRGGNWFAEITMGPPVNRHRPSVDVLFKSVANLAGANALGIIMTGMGDDGARGLLDMREAGALTLAQDEESCTVYGMPKEAVKIGAVDYVASPEEIAAAITSPRWAVSKAKADSLNASTFAFA